MTDNPELTWESVHISELLTNRELLHSLTQARFPVPMFAYAKYRPHQQSSQCQ
jgi:hypothetical protein